MPNGLRDRARHADRIDAVVIVAPAVLERLQNIEVARVDIFRFDGHPPAPVGQLRRGGIAARLVLVRELAQQLTVMWDTMHRECRKLGITVVTGHTGRYENCHYPMVGGATMVGVGEMDEYVTPRFARAGDKIIITKGPAIEATGLFGVTFPGRIEKALGTDMARRAAGVFGQMSVVQDCRIAAAIGVRNRGVTSMHDATECGLYGGLVEVAQASGVGMRIEKEAIPVPEVVSRVCGHFGIDPFTSISEGTLIVTCKPFRAQALLAAFSGVSIPAAIIGEVIGKERGIVLVEGGAERELRHPRLDPFWAAFGEAMAASRRV